MIIFINGNNSLQSIVSLMLIGIVSAALFLAFMFSVTIAGLPLYYGFGEAIWATLSFIFLSLVINSIRKKYKRSGFIKTLNILSTLCALGLLSLVLYNALIAVPRLEENLSRHLKMKSLNFNESDAKKVYKSILTLPSHGISYSRDSLYSVNHFGGSDVFVKRFWEQFDYLPDTPFYISPKNLAIFKYAIHCTDSDYTVMNSPFCNNLSGIKLRHGIDFMDIVTNKNGVLAEVMQHMNISIEFNDGENAFNTVNAVSCALNKTCLTLGRNGIEPFSKYISPTAKEQKTIDIIINKGQLYIDKETIRFLMPRQWDAPLVDHVIISLIQHINSK